ncbi:gamma-glutamyltranspeptidase/glutathione hydrolase [Cupriavidus gilardii J11]|uniref:Glutathione hydrolase proenzyme n=1 Tax=Cupriavidus gilardii J11 TaxID=936133 RepID=A0A562BK82_9BURK|nr:gamma-glutamyltranspeptidase/glutathione hydrolase [Cupriavidus gilardii J11]
MRMQDFESPGRSSVMARNGMAATSHPASTMAAIQVLDGGGNAMDAAVAACAVQCVVEPGSTGIGGDCFALYAKGGAADVVAYNGSGWAPSGISPAALKEKGVTSLMRPTPHGITVPGAIDAWDRLIRDHGSMPLADVLKPAIRHAEEGYAITPRVARDWALGEPLMLRNEHAARVMLPGGKAPRAGTVHRQPELAATLRRIGREGRDAFYRGAIAEETVRYLQSLGGFHTEADFAEYRGEYVTPIRTRFRGYDIHECPPNGQGVIALLILNILSGFPAEGDPLSTDRLHLEIEATRLAYAARDEVLCDPDFSPVDVERLLSPEYADELRARIDPRRASEVAPVVGMPEHLDTVYITVVDKDRNCASFINSLFYGFGSGIMTPTTGILLHNRGQSFSLFEGHPNVIAPRKRPLHTIIPGMATRDGKAALSFGVMGGHYQAMGHAHLLSKVLDYGMDLQDAVSLPRVFPTPGSNAVEVERTVPPAVIAELRARGFEIRDRTRPIGGAQVIRIDWEHSVLTGASDHRKDGCAIGL